MEHYCETIAKVMYDYAKQNKEIDFSFIDKIAQSVISELSLNNYITDVDIGEIPDYGWYSYDSGKIILNLTKLIGNSKPTIITRMDLYKSVVEILLHEIGHAKFLKIACEGEESWSIKGEIARCMYKEWLKVLLAFQSSKKENKINSLEKKSNRRRRQDLLYEAYDPDERLARLYAATTLLNVVEVMGGKNTKDYYFEKLKELNEMLVGYNEVESPTIYFFLKTRRRPFAWMLENWQEGEDLKKRLELGLQISYSEYQEVLEEARRIRQIYKSK